MYQNETTMNITRKNRYIDIVDTNGDVVMRGREIGNNYTTFRTTLHTSYEGGVCEVNIEKFEIVVCGYSKKKPYRHQYNGYKPTLETRYRYTYTEGGKRLTSKDFKSLHELIIDKNEKTSKVKMGINTMEVLETE